MKPINKLAVSLLSWLLTSGPGIQIKELKFIFIFICLIIIIIIIIRIGCNLIGWGGGPLITT
jgi:hypothetical protein